MDVHLTVGERVRQLRAARGLTQKELGVKIGLTDSYMSLLESGKREVTAHVAGLLAPVLGCTVTYLLTGHSAPVEVVRDRQVQATQILVEVGKLLNSAHDHDAVMTVSKSDRVSVNPESWRVERMDVLTICLVRESVPIPLDRRARPTARLQAEGAA